MRSLCNSYTISGFWRGWHASFNAWLLRYVYSPLRREGGLARHTAAVLTFLFTTLWHDFALRLLAWGALNVACLLLERAIAAAAARTWRAAASGWQWRQLQAVGGAVNIVALIAANAVGYGGGFSSVRGVVSAGGGRVAALAFGVLFSGAQVMLELREIEAAGRDVRVQSTE